MKVRWKDRGSVDHELIWGSIALLIVLAAALLPVDRIAGRAGLRCPFRSLTGLPCPTCGGTRAVTAMGDLRFQEGLAHNPLVGAAWLCAVLFVPYSVLACLGGRKRLRIADVTDGERRTIAWLALCLLLANWAYVIAHA